MDNKDFVPFQTAKKLKEAGFDEPCSVCWLCEPNDVPSLYSSVFSFKNKELEGLDFTVPTLWQAAKWLREERGILLWAYPDRQPVDEDWSDDELTGEWWWEIDGNARESSGDTYPSYEAALSAGIDAVLDLIINKTE